MKHKIIYHRQVQVCAALIAADCSVFSMVNPLHANAVWLIIGYLLLGVTLFAVASLLAQGFRSYGVRTQRLASRFLRYGATTAVILVGLQSIGQLTVKDVLTLLPFTVLAYLYFGYGRRLAPQTSPNK